MDKKLDRRLKNIEFEVRDTKARITEIKEDINGLRDAINQITHNAEVIDGRNILSMETKIMDEDLKETIKSMEIIIKKLEKEIVYLNDENKSLTASFYKLLEISESTDEELFNGR